MHNMKSTLWWLENRKGSATLMKKERGLPLASHSNKSKNHCLTNIIFSTEIEVISDKFIVEIARYQSLLNTLYERSVRECFERSISILTATVKQISQFMSESVSGGKYLNCLEDPNF
jgi:hypothetical protein